MTTLAELEQRVAALEQRTVGVQPGLPPGAATLIGMTLDQVGGDVGLDFDGKIHAQGLTLDSAPGVIAPFSTVEWVRAVQGDQTAWIAAFHNPDPQVAGQHQGSLEVRAQSDGNQFAGVEIRAFDLDQSVTGVELELSRNPISVPKSQAALTIDDDAGGLAHGATLLNGLGGTSYLRKLADQTIAGASAATIDFQNINQRHAHLLLIVYGRSTAAVATVSLYLRFNNDSAAVYDYQQLYGNAAAAGAGEAFAQNQIRLGTLPGATAPANVFGSCHADIPHYAGTVGEKTLNARGSTKAGTTTTTLVVEQTACFWRSAAAINRLTLLLSGGNFEIGSRATVYGLGHD